jgi:outer membrane autotransporter protein
VFSGSGDVEMAHRGNFGAGGDFGFDQSNDGWEIGIDSRPGEHFAFGLIFADARGTQRLDGMGGSDRFDAKTFGLYGTHMGDNGFYVDVSMRWIGIDARLRSASGEHRTGASADAFNVESGLAAWSLASGVNVVPQVQYTRTRIADIRPVASGAAEFVGDGGVSSRGRLGVALDKRFEHAGFTWTPYGSLNAIHEFDGVYEYAINGGLLGSTSTEGTSAMLELGLGASNGALSVTGGLNWTDGGAMQGVGSAQLVIRYAW